MTRQLPLSLVLSFVSALVGAVEYNGGADAFGLYLSLVSLLSCAFIMVGRAGIDGQLKVPLNLCSAALAAECIWLIVLLPISIFLMVSFHLSWVFCALPASYFLVVAAGEAEFLGRFVRSAIGALGIAIFGLAILEFIVLRDRPTSTFLDPNLFAAFCNALFFPAYFLYFGARHSLNATPPRSSRGILWLAGLALICLTMTTSRGGHLVFLAGLGTSTLLLQRIDRRALKWGAAVLLAFAVLLTVVAHFQLNTASSFERIATTGHDESAKDRFEILKSALAMYRDHPWHGVGVGNFKTLYPMYRSANEHSTSGDLVHNDYLQFLVEGGPVLLTILLALAFSSIRLLRIAANELRRPDAAELDFEQAGIAVAVCCTFLHAAVNFIFYSLLISVVTGLYLGRLEQMRPRCRSIDLFRFISPRTIRIMIFALALFCLGTLGLRAAFFRISTGQCGLRACVSLTNDQKFLVRYATFMAATQPSWLPARDWLIRSYLASADQEKDLDKQTALATVAVRELSTILTEYPAAPGYRTQLAQLLEKYPQAARSIKYADALSPANLYREALAYDPTDVVARTHLAQALERDGKDTEAFALVFDDGMRWWNVATLGDTRRLLLLRYSVPLALKLGRCKDAQEMAQGLLIFDGAEALAAKVVASLPADSSKIESTPGCGLASETTPVSSKPSPNSY